MPDARQKAAIVLACGGLADLSKVACIPFMPTRGAVPTAHKPASRFCLPRQLRNAGSSRRTPSLGRRDPMKIAIGTVLLLLLACGTVYSQEPDKDKEKEKARPAQQQEPQKREPERRPPDAAKNAERQQQDARKQKEQQRDSEKRPQQDQAERSKDAQKQREQAA